MNKYVYIYIYMYIYVLRGTSVRNGRLWPSWWTLCLSRYVSPPPSLSFSLSIYIYIYFFL